MDWSSLTTGTGHPIIWNIHCLPSWLWVGIQEHQFSPRSHELALDHLHWLWRTTPGIHQQLQIEHCLHKVQWNQGCCYPDLVLFNQFTNLDHASHPSHGHCAYHHHWMVRESYSFPTPEGNHPQGGPYALRVHPSEPTPESCLSTTEPPTISWLQYCTMDIDALNLSPVEWSHYLCNCLCFICKQPNCSTKNYPCDDTTTCPTW